MTTRIIEQRESFHVLSDDGQFDRQFYFDENSGRRAITGKATKKRALQEARAFAGSGAQLVHPAGSADRVGVPRAVE